MLDLGAGTGKLTTALVALGAEVIAVEPDPAMLTELRHTMPTVDALPGSAEAIPLPDASVDAVLAGHALHWFDMKSAGPEIARVLTSGGILAGLWNVLDDRVDWVAGLERVSGSAAIGPRDTLSSWRDTTAESTPSKQGPDHPVRQVGASRIPTRATQDRRLPRRSTRDKGRGARHEKAGTRGRTRSNQSLPRQQTGNRQR